MSNEEIGVTVGVLRAELERLKAEVSSNELTIGHRKAITRFLREQLTLPSIIVSIVVPLACFAGGVAYEKFTSESAEERFAAQYRRVEQFYSGMLSGLLTSASESAVKSKAANDEAHAASLRIKAWLKDLDKAAGKLVNSDELMDAIIKRSDSRLETLGKDVEDLKKNSIKKGGIVALLAAPDGKYNVPISYYADAGDSVVLEPGRGGNKYNTQVTPKTKFKLKAIN